MQRPLAILLALAAGCSSPDTAPVRISVDAQGMKHITCETDAQCVTALGYLHARDRFLQMDLQRRSMRGRLATLAGESQLPADLRQRTFLSTATGEPLEQAIWDRLSPPSRELFTAYAGGVNRWIDDLRA